MPPRCVLTWSFDPAASSPRLRAFFDQYDIVVYEDGEWAIRTARLHVVGGSEPSQAQGQWRANLVLDALTAPPP